MRRIIFTVLALTLFGGVASADRGQWRRARDTSHHSGGTVVRDHRHHNVRKPVRVDRHRGDRYRVDRGDRYRHRPNPARVQRRPVYINNGRFVFHGGITRTYRRPVIKYRYYDYRYRPAPVYETYDPVEGYIWVSGHWRWNGYEWTWINGYYAPDPSWHDPYYPDYYGY